MPHKGYKQTAEHRKHRSDVMKGKTQSPEHIKHVSAALKGKVPNWKNGPPRGFKGKCHTEEWKANHSATMKAYWQSQKQAADKAVVASGQTPPVANG